MKRTPYYLCLPIVLMTITACNAFSLRGSEPTAPATVSVADETPITASTATPTETAATIVRLYYPNTSLVQALSQQYAEGELEPGIGIDPRIHIEERAFEPSIQVNENEITLRTWPAHVNMNCAGDYAYIEKSIPASDYSMEYVMNMLFANELTDEERQIGFYNELNGLSYISLNVITDTEGAISGQPGAEYVELVIHDGVGYFAEGGSERYALWEQESAFFGGGCFWESVLSQIAAPVFQFYPDCVASPIMRPDENQDGNYKIYLACNAET